MTPEEAINTARAISVRYRWLAAEVESEALYAYVIATKSWRPGGVAFRRYARRRIFGAGRDVLRRELWTVRYARPVGLCEHVQDHGCGSMFTPDALLGWLAGMTSRNAAISAWLYWGFDYTLKEVADAIGLSDSRVLQLLHEIQDFTGVERTQARHRARSSA